MQDLTGGIYDSTPVAQKPCIQTCNPAIGGEATGKGQEEKPGVERVLLGKAEMKIVSFACLLHRWNYDVKP